MLIEGRLVPDVSPMRILALYVATYVDTWANVVSMHQDVTAALPSTLDNSELLAAAQPKILAHLEQRQQATIISKDMLLHTVIRSGLEEFRLQSFPSMQQAQNLLNKLSSASESTKIIIAAYYQLQLRDTALCEKMGMPSSEIPSALCKARSDLDWRDQQGIWQVSEGGHSLPSLMQDFMQGHLDKDSIALLGTTLSNDLTKLAAFERQWRMHMMLLAAFVQLPFPVTKRDAHASEFRQKGIINPTRKSHSGPMPVKRSRGKVASSPSNRIAATQSSSQMVLFMVGGCFVLAAVLGVILLSGNKTSATNQSLVNDNTSSEPVVVVDARSPVRADTSAPSKTVRVLEKETETTSATVLPVTAPTSNSTNKNNAITSDQSVIDLLAMVDLTKDIVQGEWQKGNESGICIRGPEKNTPNFRLQLPYIVPEEYDLLVTFTRVAGDGDIVFILNKQGQQIMASIGSYNDQFAGFSRVNEKKVNKNSTSVPAPLLEHGKRFLMTVKVRKERLELLLDDALVTTWESKNGPLSTNESWALPHDQAIGLGLLRGSFDIFSIGIRDITGSGRFGRLEPNRTSEIADKSTEKTTTIKNELEKNVVPQFDYHELRDSIYADLAQDQLALSRSRLKQALVDPTYAAIKAQLQLDLAAVALQEENLAAVPQGARLLLDGRKHTLEDKTGKKIEVIRGGSTEVKSISDAALMLELKVGDGRVSLELPFKNLSVNTCATFAREGLAGTSNADIHAVIYEILLCKLGQNVVPDYQMKAWFNKARTIKGQEVLTAHLEAYYNEFIKEQNIALHLEKLQKQVEKQGEIKELELMVKILADIQNELKATFAHTRLEARQQAVLALVKKRIDDVNAIEKARLNTAQAEIIKAEKIIFEWNFKDGLGSWTKKLNIANFKTDGTDMIGEVRNDEAYIIAGGLDIPLVDVGSIEIIMRADKDRLTEVYFATSGSKAFKKLGEVTIKGADYQTLRFDAANSALFKGTLKSLRIDPINSPGSTEPSRGRFSIRSIKIVGK